MKEYNNLYNVKFKLDFVEPKLRDLEIWVQSVILPSISLESSLYSGMRRDIPIPGQKVEFESFIFNFVVDQQLDNYYSIYEWMQRISKEPRLENMTSNCVLSFLDGNNAVTRTVDIVGAYPSVLTELSLNSDDTDIVPVTCSLTMNYQYFKFGDKEFPSWASNKL